MARTVSLALSLAGGVAAALMGWPAHAGHPLFTDDTGTQGANGWQWEINTDSMRTQGVAPKRWAQQVNGTVTRGMTDDLDLAFSLPLLRHGAPGEGAHGGLGDAGVQAKWRFHDNAAGWSMGLKRSVTLPTGRAERGMGNGRPTAAVVLVSSLEAGGWNWLVNGGYVFNGNRVGQRRHLWLASTAALYTLSERWTLAAELTATRNAEDTGPRATKTSVVGLLWHVSQDTDLDMGWRRSVGGKPVQNTLGVGLTVRW